MNMKFYKREILFLLFMIVISILWFVFVEVEVYPHHSKLASMELSEQNKGTIQQKTEMQTEKQTEKPTETATRQVTTEEYLLLLRVCMSECGGRYGEPLEGKVAVVETILNRVDMGYGTIKEVVFAKDQYSMADNGEPDYTVVEAVEIALQGDMYPDDMLYFRTRHYHTFGTPYMQIGSHYFSTK